MKPGQPLATRDAFLAPPAVRDSGEATAISADGALARLALWLADVSAEAELCPSAKEHPPRPDPARARRQSVGLSISGSDR